MTSSTPFTVFMIFSALHDSFIDARLMRPGLHPTISFVNFPDRSPTARFEQGHSRAAVCAVSAPYYAGARGRREDCVCATLQGADPAVPEELNDRQADNWRPLFAMADEAGGAWADLAPTAARTLSGTVVEADHAAPIQLLADVRDLFVATPTDTLATATIIRHLTALADRPWADYAQGHPITPRHLAKLLDGFRINAKQIRLGPRTLKGYLRADFTDAFGRYLPGPKHRNTLMLLWP